MGASVDNEFSFLSAQQEEWNLPGPLPSGERLALTLPDGRVLSAIRYGDDAPVVTFLHGAGLNAHTWDTTILTAGLPALAIDLPGHGDSSWREDANYTARVLAPDVARALRAWTTRPQLLVGHSLGGLTAAAVAAEFPEHVTQTVIVDITPGVKATGGPRELREFFAGPTDWATREELVDRALAFGLGGSREAATRGVYLNSRVRKDGRIEWKHHFAHLAAAAARTPEPDPSSADAPETTASETNTVAATLTPLGWDDLARIDAPVTLIRGDRGYISAADLTEFSRRVPHAQIQRVTSGHNIQEEVPDILGGIIQGMVTQEATLE